MSYSNYPDDITAPDLCHMGGHDYGTLTSKPVSTCRQCGEQNPSLRGFIGFITRKAREWDVSWMEACRRWEDEQEARYTQGVRCV